MEDKYGQVRAERARGFAVNGEVVLVSFYLYHLGGCLFVISTRRYPSIFGFCVGRSCRETSGREDLSLSATRFRLIKSHCLEFA